MVALGSRIALTQRSTTLVTSQLPSSLTSLSPLPYLGSARAALRSSV